jgi:hypothetical protein
MYYSMFSLHMDDVCVSWGRKFFQRPSRNYFRNEETFIIL